MQEPRRNNRLLPYDVYSMLSRFRESKIEPILATSPQVHGQGLVACAAAFRSARFLTFPARMLFHSAPSATKNERPAKAIPHIHAAFNPRVYALTTALRSAGSGKVRRKSLAPTAKTLAAVTFGLPFGSDWMTIPDPADATTWYPTYFPIPELDSRV